MIGIWRTVSDLMPSSCICLYGRSWDHWPPLAKGFSTSSNSAKSASHSSPESSTGLHRGPSCSIRILSGIQVRNRHGLASWCIHGNSRIWVWWPLVASSYERPLQKHFTASSFNAVSGGDRTEQGSAFCWETPTRLALWTILLFYWKGKAWRPFGCREWMQFPRVFCQRVESTYGP